MRIPLHRRFARPGVLPAGSTLGGDLTLLGMLGEGGAGYVYRAYHSVLKREVAVKMCHATGPGSRELSERLVREARMCASVRDPRVPRIYALAKREDGTPYLVMEMVRGEPLSELLRRGRVRARVACELGCELLRALAAVHRVQLVHRDVKPSNVLVDLDAALGTPRLRLLDFGIGKMLHGSQQHSSPALTRPGEVVGTPMYMAPEQMLEGAIDQRADLYGAGIVLYEMLAGRPPFCAPSVAETFVAVLRDEMPDLDLLRPGLPPALRALVKILPGLPEHADPEHDLSLWERVDERSPTLIWQRPSGLPQSHARRARRLPTSCARTLRAVEQCAGASEGVHASTPLGFRARRPTMAVKVGGWRVATDL